MLACASALLAAQGAAGYSVEFSPGGALSLSHGLWKVAATSRVLAVDRDWNRYFYDRDSGGRCVKTTEGAAEIYSFEFSGGSEFMPDKFKVTAEGDSVVIELAGTLAPGRAPGVLEYTAMIMPDEYFRGAAYVAAMTDGKLAEGVIGEPSEHGADLIGGGFRKIVFVSADGLAKLSVSVESGLPLTLSECRNNPWFEGEYGLRLGVNIPLEPGRRVAQSIKAEAVLITNPGVRLSPVPASTCHREVDQIYEQKPDRSPIPYAIRPKRSGGAPEHPDFSGGFGLTVSGVISGDDAIRLGLAADRINRDELGASPSAGAPEVAVTIVPSAGEIPSPDGFVMSYSADRLTIAATAARGAFYGLQEFRRQLSCGRFENVTDYPDLGFRGVFIFSSSGSFDFNRELIDRVLVPCRVNQLVIESSRVHWDTFPSLRNPSGMSKAELAELLDYARSNFIECTPCIATLGHMEWMFDGGANLEFAEDPARPYGYFTSHPGLYPLMERFLSEVLDTFRRPRYLHIGHDEWLLAGRFPFRPETRLRTPADIFYGDVMFYYNFAKSRGTAIMMWQDMVCTPDESGSIGSGGPPHNLAALRPRLPRDLVFAVWRYDSGETLYKDIHALSSEGFGVIGCGWNRPGNVESLARDCRRAGALGYLQTTWAGYFPSAAILDSEFEQVIAYGRAGVSAWNADQQLDDPGEALRTAWARLRPIPSASGVAVELPAATAPGESLLPFGSEWRRGFVDGVWFDRFGGNTVSIRSRYQPDSAPEVTFPVNAKARKLHFLHTTRLFPPSARAVLGSYTLNYADGSHCEFELESGVQVQSVAGARTLRRGVKAASGSEAVLRGCSFVNPRPELEIASITLRGSRSLLPVELAALTLEQ